MAGAYGDAPGRRIAYDADGTTALYVAPNQSGGSIGGGGSSTTPWSIGTGPQLVAMNDENALSYGWAHGADYYQEYIVGAFMFPEKRDIDGIYNNAQCYSYWSYWSGDSTNGIDGTWTDTGIAMRLYAQPHDDYRTNISLLSLSSAAALKFLWGQSSSNQSTYVYRVHFYGVPAASETPDRLLFLDTLNSDAEFTKPLDYGDIQRGTTQTRTIKLKNNSATKAINTVQVTAEDLYLNAGGWYEFSEDDVSYSATLTTIGNIAALGTQLVYVKQTVPGDETLGVQDARIKASHASLT